MRQNKVQQRLLKQIQATQLFDASDHVLVAFSGGQDSMVLLNWLTKQHLPADLQPKVSALYVNHHLREDVAQEEALVKQTFQANQQLAHTKIAHLNWDEQPTVGIEAQARDKRYAALIAFANEIGANKIVTAHHETDQAETILYKLIRGGRVTQLKGMQMRTNLTDQIELVRPFLGLPKAQLATLLNAPLEAFITDSSNANNQYARNRLRNRVMPELVTINQQAEQHITEVAEQLSGMEYLLQPEIKRQISALEDGSFDWQMPDAAIQFVLQEWLNQQQVYHVKAQQLAQAIQLMRNQSVSTGKIALEKGDLLERTGRSLRLRTTD